jgi:hypothetical protein
MEKKMKTVSIVAILGVVGIAIVGASFLLFSKLFSAKTAGEDEDALRASLATHEQQVEETLKKSNLQAAQYDYDKATETIKAFQGYDQENAMTQALTKYSEQKAKLVRYADLGSIPHIFFHSLIVDPHLAFSSPEQGAGYNQYMATVSEFKKIIEEMYKRDFVLVSMHDIMQLDANQNMVEGSIMLPPGKKPIVISQDDVNYYYYMQNSGFADKLMVGADGRPTTQYTTANGEKKQGEYDLVPILDNFVDKHPDFSYRGRKATLGITGYNGVLGYRTDLDDEKTTPESRASEAAEAKKTADALKADGYEFASHSYGHIGFKVSSVQSVLEDDAKWDTRVKPILGPTDLFIYPFGQDLAGIEEYSGPKFDDLYAKGFRYFANVDGSQPAWLQVHKKYIRQARRNVDGYRMFYNPDFLSDLFSVPQIWDEARPKPVKPI